MAQEKSTDKKSNTEKCELGYWERHLGRYLAYPMAVYAAMAIGALFFKASLWLIGNPTVSFIPALIAGVGAGNIAFGYFCQDGHALKNKLEKWGRELDKIKRTGWLNFFNRHKLMLSTGLVTLAVTIATIVVSILFPPAFLMNFSAITGLNNAGIAILTGGVAFLACRLLHLLLKGIAAFVGKKPGDRVYKVSNIWRKILYEVLGVALGITGALFAMVATYQPLLELFGVGAAASILSVAVAGIAGLVYFCRDGLSIRKRMEAWSTNISETVRNFNFRHFLTKHKKTLMGAAVLAAVTAATLGIVVFWQPAPIANFLAMIKLDGLSQLGLTAVMGSVIWGCCFIGSLIKGHFTKQPEYDVVDETEDEGKSEKEIEEEVVDEGLESPAPQAEIKNMPQMPPAIMAELANFLKEANERGENDVDFTFKTSDTSGEVFSSPITQSIRFTRTGDTWGFQRSDGTIERSNDENSSVIPVQSHRAGSAPFLH